MKRGLGDLLASLQGDLIHARKAWEQVVLPHLVDACRRDVHEDTGALGNWQAWLADDGRAVIGQLAGPRAAHQLLALGHVLAAAQLVAREGRWSADDSEHLLGLLPAEIAAAYPRPFLRDLLRQLGGRPTTPIATARVLFPLVLPSADAVLARFQLDLLPDGTDQVFLDPHQAVSRELGPVFAATFDQARDIARGLLGDGARGGDVRVAIEPHDESSETDLQRYPLFGTSAGGALALGLWSLWQGMPLDTGLVVSFALAADGKDTDGRCHEVGGDIKKARGVLERGFRTFLLAAEQPVDVDAWGKELGLTVARAATLHEATGIASGLASDLRAYYEALIDKLAQTPWRHADGLPVLAEDIAIPVQVLKEEQRDRGRRDRAEDDERDRRLSFVDPEVARYYEEPALERHRALVDWRTERSHIGRAVVLGAPGGGKSFLTALTAIDLAREGLAALAEGRPLDELPVPVHLDLADLAKALGHHEDPARALVDVLRAHAPRGLKDVAWDWIAERARSSHGWLLLDALDQVEHERRPALHGWLEQVQQQRWACRALVTCRSANYDRGWIPWRSPTEYELAPFEPGEVHRLVDRWFARDPDRGRLLDGVLDRSFPLAQACRSPLVASLVCLVHEEQALHDQVRRADLYPRALRLLLQRGWQARGVVHDESDLDERLWLLEHVAWILFPKHPEVNQFAHAEVHKALQDAIRELGLDLSVTAARKELLAAGILVEAGLDARSESQLSFLHRSFVEYLVARALVRRASDEGWGAIAGLVDKKAWHPAWYEVILFLAGQLDDAAPLLDQLVDAPNDAFHVMLLLAGHCVREVSDRVDSASVSTVARRLAELLGSQSLVDVELAASALARMKIPEALEALLSTSIATNEAFSAIIDALGQTEDARAVDPLLHALNDRGSRFSHAAFLALGRLGDERALAAIVAYQEDPFDTDPPEDFINADPRIDDDTARWRLMTLWNPPRTMRGNLGILPAAERMLELPDLDTRLRAVKILQVIDHPRCVVPLLRAVEDADIHVRSAALDGLGTIGGQQSALECRKLLRDERAEVRASAARALGAIRDRTSVQELITALADENANVRDEVANALGEIADPTAVAPLIAALSGEDASIATIARALAEVGDRTATAELCELLSRQSATLPGPGTDSQSSIAPDSVTLEEDAALNSWADSQYSLIEVADALGRLGDSRAVACLEEVVDVAEFDLAMHAAEALGRIDPPRATEPLLRAIREFKGDRHAAERLAAAVRPLLEAGEVRIVRGLIDALRAGNLMIRREAPWLLASTRLPWVIDELLLLLDEAPEPLPETRLGADDAIAVYDIEFLRDDVRHTIIWALGSDGDRRATPRLIAFVEESPKRWGRDAIHSLGRLADPAAFAKVVKVLFAREVADDVTIDALFAIVSSSEDKFEMCADILSRTDRLLGDERHLRVTCYDLLHRLAPHLVRDSEEKWGPLRPRFMQLTRSVLTGSD
jgi:HEAT repeat protein